MRPLALFVLVEAVVLVWLAMLWFAGGSAPAVAAPSRDVSAAAPSAAAALNAPLAAPPPAAPRESTAPPREAAPAAVPNVVPGDAIGIVLSVLVRGPDRAPVDANVGVSREGAYRGGNGAVPGTYAIAGLQPGECTLTCRADGFAPHEQTITLDERAFQQVDVALQQSFVVRVKIQGADGKPIAAELRKTRASLPSVVATEQPLTGDLPPTFQSRLTRFGIGEWRSFDEFSGRDVDPKLKEQGYAGELRLHRAPPAHVSLLLRTALLQSQRLEPGQQELVFTIEPKDVSARHGTIKLRLLDAAGAPIAKAPLNVSTAQGGGTGGLTDDAGVGLIANVAPGIGTLELHGPAEREQVYRFVRVPSGGTLDLGDITLGAVEKITGVVLGLDGKPANGASVQWTELDSRTFPQQLVDNRSASADAEGRFTLWGTGRRRYVVFARLRDGSLGTATIDARNGAPAETTIRLGTPAKITLQPKLGPTDGFVVTVLDGERSPVAVATLASEFRSRALSVLPGDYTVEIHDMRTDRLARSFALQVGGEPLTIDVP
jgi:hypothetical protein